MPSSRATRCITSGPAARSWAFYRRCYRALRPGGVLINGDCAPASTPRYESWANEDVYVPLAEEIRLLERAGFAVDVPWRRSPFAVIVGCRHA